MPQCCVFGCSHKTGKDKTFEGRRISYHKFPLKPALRRAWILRLSRKNWTPSDNSVVCSIHFVEDDFEEDIRARIMGVESKGRILKPEATPSLHLRGKKRDHSPVSSTPRHSAYLTKKKRLEDEDYVQKLLFSSNDEDLSSVSAVNLNATTDVMIQCETLTHDRRIQVHPTTSHVMAQTTLLLLRTVSTQTDLFTSPDCDCIQIESDVESLNKGQTDRSDSDDSDDDYFPSSDCDSSFDSDSDVDINFEDQPESHQPPKESSFKVVLCFVEYLLPLLKFCPDCGAPVDSKHLRFDGGMLCIKLVCLKGCDYLWTSQPTLSGQRSRSGSGDFQLAVSVILCGGTYALLKAVSDTMSLGIISSSVYYRLQSKYVAPVIFSAWSAQQSVLIDELKNKTSVRLAGDSRCDSPGYSAKYSTYTFMDCDTGRVVCGRTVQLGQETSSSVRMEKVGFKSCLDYLLNCNAKVDVITTDRSPSIIGAMNSEYPDIVHQYDIWHIAKSLKKKLLAAGKKKPNSVLNEWIRSIINHLYYCVQHCNSDPDLLRELWLSELQHIRGIHQWEESARFRRVLICAHDIDMDENLAKDGLKKSYLLSNSEAFKILESIVAAPKLMSALRHCTLALSTASLENLHSIMLKYVPKRLHFRSVAMNMRICLTYIDHNANVQREAKQNCFKFQFSKVSGQWVARCVYRRKGYQWRTDLLTEIIHFRKSGLLPLDSEPPFSNLPVPQNIAPLPMPSKEELCSSHQQNSRHIS